MIQFVARDMIRNTIIDMIFSYPLIIFMILKRQTKDTIMDTIRDTTRDTIRNTTRDTIRNTIRDTIRDTIFLLRDTIWRDTIVSLNFSKGYNAKRYNCTP